MEVVECRWDMLGKPDCISQFLFETPQQRERPFRACASQLFTSHGTAEVPASLFEALQPLRLVCMFPVTPDQVFGTDTGKRVLRTPDHWITYFMILA